MPRNKYTLQDAINIATERGGFCLSTEYINIMTKMEWMCVLGHRWFVVFNNIKNSNSWCPYCAGNVKLNLQDCQNLAMRRNGNCLSKVYVNSMSDMEWICEFGHKWICRLNDIKKGQWCYQCHMNNIKLTLQNAIDLAMEKSGKCLSVEYINAITPIIWKCSRNHIWNASLSSVKQGKWCYKCAINSMKLDLQQCIDFALTKSGKCLSTEYINIFTKMSWECSDGHQWNSNFNNIKNHNRWCPECFRQGNFPSETMVRQTFETLFTNFKFPNKRYQWLNGLELDGYNEELKLAFEYNGIQHYEIVDRFHKTKQDLLNQQKRDKEKRELCIQHRIQLITIPYQYNYQNEQKMQIFIIEELMKYGYRFNKMNCIQSGIKLLPSSFNNKRIISPL